VRVLGIDPGSETTGWGVIDGDRRRYTLVEYGSSKTKANEPFATRLLQICEAIEEIIARLQPDSCALEDGFLKTNVKVTLKLGQVRGVAMLAAARAALEINEYAPRLIKQTVVGYGNAEKHQVGEMVRILLSLKSAPQPHDGADALAVAICHFHHTGIKERILAADARVKLSSSIATHRRASR